MLSIMLLCWGWSFHLLSRLCFCMAEAYTSLVDSLILKPAGYGPTLTTGRVRAVIMRHWCFLQACDCPTYLVTLTLLTLRQPPPQTTWRTVLELYACTCLQDSVLHKPCSPNQQQQQPRGAEIQQLRCSVASLSQQVQKLQSCTGSPPPKQVSSARVKHVVLQRLHELVASAVKHQRLVICQDIMAIYGSLRLKRHVCMHNRYRLHDYTCSPLE
jgi:hypothetical protein